MTVKSLAIRALTVVAAAGLGLAGLGLPSAQAQAPAAAPGGPPGPPGMSPAMLAAMRAAMNERRMIHVTGSLYQVQYGGINTVHQMVYVTSAGIIVTDTENTADAQWLKDQLAHAFPGKPVRYIILSHWHFDHANGMQVFPQAKVITSDEIVKKMRSLNLRYAPPPGDSIDLNGDNRISRSEARTSLMFGFDRFDTNKDGFIEPQELLVGIRMPDITFTGRKTLTLGDRQVELIERPGRSGGVGGMVDSYFPAEKVLFVNDYMGPHRVYPAWANFDNAPLSEWVAAIKQLNSLDYLMYVSAHWENGTRQDLENFGQFLQDVNRGVLKGIAAGKSLEELQRTIPPTLDASYREWADYAQNLPANIAGAYHLATLYRDCASMGLGLPASKPGPGVGNGAVCYYGPGAT
ncbi:MAG TPA: MBL fold metallo-hydrolase [Steroidobacteraceae bacterium]|jgi:glyoxylase-like metal-dependent hydrolase (beta-lactamase superfamily II)|nr:MBL fold metallo-hydrolase [Steroidobacteraceae bacterium]